jgi:hypothetical protein
VSRTDPPKTNPPKPRMLPRSQRASQPGAGVALNIEAIPTRGIAAETAMLRARGADPSSANIGWLRMTGKLNTFLMGAAARRYRTNRISRAAKAVV